MHGAVKSLFPRFRPTESWTLPRQLDPTAKKEVVGIRAGEKIHEEMITESDSLTTVDLGDYYAILPQSPAWNIGDYVQKKNARRVEEGFKYNSGKNTQWLSVEDIRTLIREHVDPSFAV